MNNRRSGISRSRITKIIAGAIILLLVLGLLLAGVYLFEKNRNLGNGGVTGDVGGEKTIEYDGKTYVINRDIETVLIIGLDAFGKAEENDSYNNDRQADFLVLLLLDRKNKTVEAIHINRDTITEVPILGVTGQQVGVTNQQISLSHTYGNGGIDSCHNVAVTLSRMFYNLPIDNYVSITMDGIKEVNDLVGGVTLTVLDDFSGIDDTLVKGEEVTLLGDHALNYVRSRGGLEDATNEHRMIRQRQYMEAFYAQSKKVAGDDDELVVDAVAKLNNYIVTNCSVSQAEVLFDKMVSYEFVGLHTIEGESQMGDQYVEFIYDEDALKKLVVELFYLPKQD